MSITNLYSKRNKGLPDVFTYEELSKKLVTQIQYIWEDFFNQVDSDISGRIWPSIQRILLKEHGLRNLPSHGPYRQTEQEQVQNYIQQIPNIEERLDVVELVFKFIKKTPAILKKNNYSSKLYYSPEKAIDDLNTRFLENGVGYEFRNDEIIRIDNKLLHQEIIIPTLHFLSTAEFKNANEEYLKAHEHFRHGRTKECLNESLKALETTLKIICHKNGWVSEKGETAKALLDLCFQKNLIPPYLANHFGGLRSTLESGVPTLRNKLGGHGQGVQAIEVPMHYASYMLYLTGTTINFLVSCQQELKPDNL